VTKAKISQYSATANDNTDVNGVNIAENCPPSSMNNMGREIMAALKRFQVGSDGDGVTVGGALVVSGATTVNTFNVDVISEKTSAAGVTVDGVLLKDNTVNKVAITAPATAATLTIANNKTLTANNSITLAGTDATTMTFPATSATIARTDAAQTFSGTQTFNVVTANFVYASNTANIGSFTWNTATSSPAAAVNVGATTVTSIHAGMRRCVMNDSGVVQYYLSPTDSTKKADGSSANIDGTDGQVMVEIPKFWVRREVSGTYITWSVSPVELPGFSLHPAFTKDGNVVNFRYYSAYDACVFDVSASAYISGQNYDNNSGAGNGVAVDVTATTGDKLASVSGVFPMVGLTRGEFRTIAANRGTGWRQLDWTLFAAVQLLYLIENQSFFSQNITGNGNTGTTYATTASDPTQAGNGGSEAGKSNALGNASTNTTSGASSASRGVAYMSYRGIENFYGNEWNWADGCIVNPDGTVSADQGDWWFTNNSADFSDSVRTNMTQIMSTARTGSGFVSAIASVDNFFIATSVSGGSSTTFLTDQYLGSTTADRVVRVGGPASDGADAGAFFVSATAVSSLRGRFFGARLAF
jgi:aspartate carbamoyltransferase regulatory subunit